MNNNYHLDEHCGLHGKINLDDNSCKIRKSKMKLLVVQWKSYMIATGMVSILLK
jgi:hypothetical protein